MNSRMRQQQCEAALRIVNNENKYNRNLRKLFTQIIEVLPFGADPMDVVRRLQMIENDPAFCRQCERIAQRMATSVTAAEYRTWREAAAAATKGRRIFNALKAETTGGTEIDQIISDIVRENAQLIKTVPRDIASDFSELIRKRQLSGLRPNAIVEELQSRAPHLTQVQARRIARTETGKAATAIRQARAQVYGRPFYIWYSSHDERVRESHRLMHGVICRWDDPPNPEQLAKEKRTYGAYHPRGIFNCRCDALTIISIEDIQFPARVHFHGEIKRIGNITAFRKLFDL